MQHPVSIRLNFNEAITLFIATRLLARYADEYNPHIVGALEKLAAALPAPGRNGAWCVCGTARHAVGN